MANHVTNGATQCNDASVSDQPLVELLKQIEMQQKVIRALLQQNRPTYHDINEQLCRMFPESRESPGAKPQQLRNLQSALRAWLKHHDHSIESPVGAELVLHFDTAVNSFSEAQAKEGKSSATVRDRRSHMRTVRDAYGLVRSHKLPKTFAAALDELILESGLTLGELARRTGLSTAALGLWRRGRQTPLNQVGVIPALEQALGAPKGVLTARLNSAYMHSMTAMKSLPVARTEFGQRISERNQSPYTLSDAEATEQLRQEVQELILYKTAPFHMLARSKRGTWRTKPRADVRPFANEAIAYLPGDRICVSAIKFWTELRQFLGWTCLPTSEGGKGLDRGKVQTVAMLSMPDAVAAYMTWRIERQGGRPNNFNISFLDMTNCLTHEETGYLTQNSKFQSRLSATGLALLDEDWKTHCQLARKDFAQMRTQMRPHVNKSRPAMAPISDFLMLPNPLKPIMKMIERMEAAIPPRTLRLKHANHLRRLFLLKLLVANPLRINQMSSIRIGNGPEANLFKNDVGEWWLQFDKSAFKNERGAARDSDYRTIVPQWAWAEIERYLSEARPYLLNGRESEYLFVQFKKQKEGRPMRCLGDDFRNSVKRFFPGHCSFGPHSIRHIVATFWLRHAGADYPTVAKLLHDALETVMSTYGHLMHEHAFRDYDEKLRLMDLD